MSPSAPSPGFNVRFIERLAGVTHRQLVHWDRTGLVRPSVREAAGSGTRRVYSFEDLVEARVVAELRRSGISLQALRRIVEQLRARHAELVRPLARLRLVTDGRKVFALTDDPAVMEELTAGGQLTFVLPVAGLVNDLREKVARLSAPRELSVRVGRRAFAVRAVPDLADGGYTLEVPELPGCYSEAEDLREARRMAREAIEAFLGAGVRSRSAAGAR